MKIFIGAIFLFVILAIPRVRYVQVRHWGSIKNNPVAIQAIQHVIK